MALGAARLVRQIRATDSFFLCPLAASERLALYGPDQLLWAIDGQADIPPAKLRLSPLPAECLGAWATALPPHLSCRQQMPRPAS